MIVFEQRNSAVWYFRQQEVQAAIERRRFTDSLFSGPTEAGQLALLISLALLTAWGLS